MSSPIGPGAVPRPAGGRAPRARSRPARRLGRRRTPRTGSPPATPEPPGGRRRRRGCRGGPSACSEGWRPGWGVSDATLANSLGNTSGPAVVSLRMKLFDRGRSGNAPREDDVTPEITKSDDEWRQQLGLERFHVLREKGTEPAWSGALLDMHDPGLFRCAACGAE